MIQKNKELKNKNVNNSINTGANIICKHCGKEVNQARLIGLSLICPSCDKSIGQLDDTFNDPYENIKVICKHCNKTIDQTLLRGISLICPHCSRHQNGVPHGHPISYEK